MSALRPARHFGVWELPEIISGILVLFIVLWELCFLGVSTCAVERLDFLNSTHLMLCCLVFFHSLLVLVHAVRSLHQTRRLSGLLLWHLVVSFISCLIFSFGFSSWWEHSLVYYIFWGSVLCSFMVGGLSFINLLAYLRIRSTATVKSGVSAWSPAVIFFTSMMAFVLLSTLILLTPGATHIPISAVDAFFMCSSAAAITGLSTVDIAATFTPLGKAVILVDIQVGAMGVMTFTYFVMLMVGQRLDMRNRLTISGILDQEGVHIVPALIKSVISVTFLVELLGAIYLYYAWKGLPGMPQEHLWAYALFHSISAFCNAGISLFPGNMSEPVVALERLGQGGMIVVMLAGTIGFGVYLELMMRLKRRWSGSYVPLRWSTHCWLVLRVTLIVLIVGTLCLTLLGWLEPSAHDKNLGNTAWEALWNTVGRSAGFNLTDINDYGPAYKLFMCVMMFVGGNPAGTGGGVFAPVVALCVLEVLRVVRGAQDVEIHQRRISRNTIERAMATVVLSVIWIVGTTIVLLALEPEIGASDNGMLKVLFEEISAYTTTGYSLGITSELSSPSKLIVAFNMIFGRVGMFTFMLVFIKQKEPNPLRYPETRLPLT